MNSHELFTNTPPRKLFFYAASPGAVSMLASALYQLFDGVFVGRILGQTAFAAVNLAMPFVIINFAIADLVGVGSSVPISIHLGRHEDDEASNYFTCASLLIVLAGVLVGGILFAAAPLLISLMGAEGEFASLAVAYLRVYGLCSPVTTIVFAVDNFMRICGKVRASMILNIFMSILSVGLEALFLIVFRWGIAGAALGTSLGMAITAVIAYVPFFRGKTLLHFCKPRFSRAMFKKIVVSGAPNFLNNIAGRITSILMNLLLVRLGGEIAVSIYGVLMYVEGFIQPLLYGMCDSLQPAVGYNWGAGALSRVKSIERYCYTAGAVVSVVSAILIFLVPEPIAGIFLEDVNATVLADTAFALRLFSFTYLTRWFSFATQSFMLAIERAGAATLISVSTALIFPVLLVAVFWPLGLTGLWLNFAGTSLLAGGLAAVIMLRFRRDWRKLAREESPSIGEPA